MRLAPTFAAALLAVTTLASSALAFDVQNGGSFSGGGGANLAPDVATPGVSIDTDLRAQLGLAEEKTKSSPLTSSGGMSFSGSVFSGNRNLNTTTMGYDESPWVAPRRPAGRD